MFPTLSSWTRAGVVTLAAAVILPLGATAAPIAPTRIVPAIADGALTPTLVQGEGRDSSASPAYRKKKYPSQSQSRQKGDREVQELQRSSKQDMKRKKRGGDRRYDDSYYDDRYRDDSRSGTSIILEIPLR